MIDGRDVALWYAINLLFTSLGLLSIYLHRRFDSDEYGFWRMMTGVCFGLVAMVNVMAVLLWLTEFIFKGMGGT